MDHDGLLDWIIGFPIFQPPCTHTFASQGISNGHATLAALPHRTAPNAFVFPPTGRTARRGSLQSLEKDRGSLTKGHFHLQV